MTDVELIRQVALRLFGRNDPQEWLIEDYDGHAHLFNPILNANHRDMVVERMREKGFAIRLWCYACGTDYGCVLTGDMTKTKHITRQKISKDWGHAVCLAALKALEEA